MVLQLLVVNPNSSRSMTEAVARSVAACDAFRGFAFQVRYMTGPSGAPPQIDGPEASSASCDACLAVLSDPRSEFHYARFEGLLVACFSDHPLVAALAALPQAPVVLGLLDASVSFASLAARGPFSIITSNVEWVKILDDSVEQQFLAGHVRRLGLWRGTVSSNLQVLELHDEANFGAIVDVIRAENVDRLGSRYVILGCAGFSGLERRLNKLFEDRGVVFLDPIVIGFQALLGSASLLQAMR
ncbi:hypothetical protein HG536_0B00380 [Torulaspora globosa]|uniref:Asp/Glu/hydantoin racemase n=1 Tax=Torulaspora globosa TaxID=48254 RepID=A0A7G3ZCE1_9SACH|nr:uncharacterized protein HG536_0B00380 [Torulaspora globosa]QLL31177.1 hypothetical protein HG536_0B00380 [Torulaspora globosa]